MSKIEINSLEYQCWHEVGHATVCLGLGGDVEVIELMEDLNAKGMARARCCTTGQEMRDRVACGGFAAEYVLFKKGFLQTMDLTQFTQIVFKNATIDREMFCKRTPPDNETFTKEEDERFMHVAINQVSPIIVGLLPQMKYAVDELLASKKLSGERLKEILGFPPGPFTQPKAKPQHG